MGDLQGYDVGQKVELSDGRTGVIQFLGATSFAEGAWIGLVLDDNSGKNDGSVQGKRYFQCESGRGMFVRPTAITEIVLQPARKSASRTSTVTNGTAPKTRPLSSSNLTAATKRQSVLDPTAKRRSINAASPTPAGRPTMSARTLRSPSKSPTKQLTSRPSSGAAALRNPSQPSTNATSLKPTAAAAKRASLTSKTNVAPVSTATKTSRPSIGGSNLNGSAQAPASTLGKQDKRVSTLQRDFRPSSASATSRSGRSDQASPAEEHERDAISPSDNNTDPPDIEPSATKSTHTPPPAKPRAAEKDAAPSRPNGALNREIEDLKTKLRVVEKQRAEDREKLKSLEKVQEERDRFESIIQKLQKKYQPQQQENAELKKQVKDLEAQLESGRSGQMDVDTAVEIATLDREMAEEKAEAYRQELEMLRAEHEEIRLEVEILREENSELGKEMSPEERTSQGWLQLERSNERLREALIRLRDMTQDSETELKEHIQELEGDNKELEGFRERFEEMKARAEQHEGITDELRQQLETAHGSEDMIEELTERNMALTEQIDELKTAIEDLENLKELNDELELNHVENEKQMQEEIDYQEAVFLEQQRLVSNKDEAIEELEYTCSKFRELVNNLQGEIEEMRASQQITESEANELSNRSKAMMDLNMRLQASASKVQVKAIEVEIGKLEAQEASDHLAIVRHFLPQSYTSDRDSVEAYLRIKRIGFKANLLHGYVKDRATGVAVPGHEDDVFAASDAAEKFVWVTAMSERLSFFVQRCSLESFTKLSTALADLEPVERACNNWIDQLKRDDFKDQACAEELSRSIALISHLAEAHITETLPEYADDVRMRAAVMQSQFERCAAVVAQIKAVSQAKILLPTDADEQDEADQERFLERADQLVGQIRSAKVVAGKALQQLIDLQARGLTLNPSTADQIEQSEVVIKDYAKTCQDSANALLNVLNDDGRTDSYTYGEATKALCSNDTLPFSTLTSKLSPASNHISSLYTLTCTLSQTVEFPSPSSPAPWTLLAQRLQAESAASSAQEREVARLKDELRERGAALAMKDRSLEEMSVNVEVLTKRVQEAGGRRDEMRKLEMEAKDREKKERELALELQHAQGRLHELEAEREDWQRGAATLPDADPEGLGAALRTPIGVPVSSDLVPARASAEIAALKAEVGSLQAAIRQLRGASYRTSLAPASLAFLSEPLYPSQQQPSSAQQRVAYEAKDCLKALVDLTTGGREARLPTLTARDKSSRLKWRPAKETVTWQARRQRETWAAWAEWRDDISKKQREAAVSSVHAQEEDDDDAQGASAQPRKKMEHKTPLARLAVGLPSKDWERRGRQVRIVRPEEWDEVERGFGLA